MSDYKDQDLMRHATQVIGNKAGQMAKKIGKRIAKSGFKMFMAVLKATAPIWMPLLIAFLLAFIAYMILYAVPRQIAEDATSGITTKIAAFFGEDENSELVKNNERLFDRYKEIANMWYEGLNEQQKSQVESHKFPWSIMAATDRVVNDAAVWEGKESVQPQPEKVFERLRPVFQWKESVVTVETVTNWYEEPDEDGEGGGCQMSTDVEEKTIYLITQADTFEGTFTYEYEWQTTVSHSPGDCGGTTTTTTQEVLKKTTTPEEYYLPWIEYLNEKGVKREDDIDLVKELAILYDEEYQFNHALTMSLDYSDYPALEGSKGWLFPTPSTRITSPYGPRGYPKSEFHKGVDIGATSRGKDGDPIWAMADGKVIFSGWNGGYGNLVIIDYGNGVTSRYAHLARRHVSSGQSVTRGEAVGIMGNTGNSYGTHLHFEVRIEDKPLNPLYYFPDIK